MEPDGFRDFVTARSAALVRSAVLLTGDEALAQDLVQAALAKTWLRWPRVVRQPVAEVPDVSIRQDEFSDADLRVCVLAAVGGLPPRQRAVIVLRYFDDLTEAQTATALGCSAGTVKSQAAKALLTLRRSPQLRGLFVDEVSN